jgi:hypothetical protein
MVANKELEAGHEGMENEEGAEEEGEEMELDEEFNLDEILAEMETEFDDEESDLEKEFKKAPNVHSYDKVLDMIDSAMDDEMTQNFASHFPKGKPITKDAFIDWSVSYDGGYDPEGYSYANWIYITDPNIYNKVGLGESSYSKKAVDPSPKSKNAIFHKGKDEYVTDETEEDDAPYSKEKARKVSFNESLALKKTIETLKSELNDINVLNAKLLYTNKIFRNKSLTESQKVKVLTAFDKTTTKKEVELVYETLLESLKVPTIKTSIKESMSSASKVLGGVTSKPIIENDAFSRMRELAFGKNK